MRPTSSSEHTLGRIWKDESISRGYYYIACSGRSISATNNQRRKLSCGGLFIIIQCHHWKTNFEQLEGSNIYLPPVSQVPYRVQGRASARRPVSSERMLFSIEERRVVVKPTEVLEDIPLNENNPEKYTKVGASMEDKMKQDLVQFLKKSIDVFAWSHKDM